MTNIQKQVLYEWKIGMKNKNPHNRLWLLRRDYAEEVRIYKIALSKAQTNSQKDGIKRGLKENQEWVDEINKYIGEER